MSKKTILVIEDDTKLANILLNKIKSEGFDVFVVNNGYNGLTSALSNKPDLILLDLELPKMSGLAMLRSLRKDPWGKSAKVIILTNTSPDKQEILESITKDNPSYYLVKTNYKLEEVIEKIKSVI